METQPTITPWPDARRAIDDRLRHYCDASPDVIAHILDQIEIALTDVADYLCSPGSPDDTPMVQHIEYVTGDAYRDGYREGRTEARDEAYAEGFDAAITDIEHIVGKAHLSRLLTTKQQAED
jgi:hypothetical protein